MNRNELVAIIPARDEEATLAAVIRKALAHTGAVVVTDDGSRDGTSSVAAHAGASVVRLARPGGYGSALIAGLTAARTRGFSCFATLDADGAHSPHDLDLMVRCHLKARNDLTIGDRFTKLARSQEIPSPKRWANYFATMLVNRILGTELGDVACGLRLMSPRFVDRLLAVHRPKGFGFAYELINVARIASHRLGSAPVSVHYDARELHATGRRELLDLLEFCILHSRGEVKRQLTRVRQRVWRNRMTACVLGGRTIVLCPLPERRAYIFQLQDEAFDTSGSSLFDLRVARRSSPKGMLGREAT